MSVPYLDGCRNPTTVPLMQATLSARTWESRASVSIRMEAKRPTPERRRTVRKASATCLGARIPRRRPEQLVSAARQTPATVTITSQLSGEVLVERPVPMRTMSATLGLPQSHNFPHHARERQRSCHKNTAEFSPSGITMGTSDGYKQA